MRVTVKTVTSFECSDGKNFHKEEDAIAHEKLHTLSQAIYDKFAVYSRIEDIDEVLLWLIEEGIIDMEKYNG